MLRTLIVGLGRSGAGLHLPVLTRLRRRHGFPFSDHPIVGCDPQPVRVPDEHGVITLGSVAAAAAALPTEQTVVHVCTPPADRAATLARVAEAGFRHLVVEKPLATDLAELALIEALRTRHRLNLVVVSHWLGATLTRRLSRLVRCGEFGPLRSITVDQDKPRFGRSAHGAGHPSAFDVEIPHSLALALALAGPADLDDAGWQDLTVVGPPVARLGGAWLTLRHHSGVRSTLRSDLTSPVRRRRLVMDLAGTTATAHFPVSADDHHAQLRVGTGRREVFEDEALSTFLLSCYRYVAGVGEPPPGDLGLHAAVVRLLHEAKLRAGRREAVASHAG